MPKILRKVVFTLFASLILIISLAQSIKPVKAADEWYNPGMVDWYSKVYNNDNPKEIFGERYTAAQVQWIIYSVISFPINVVFQGNTSAVSCLLNATADQTLDISDCAEGFVGMIGDLADRLNILNHIQATTPDESPIAKVFNTTDRPLSGIGYVKSRVNNFSLVPEAKAQEGIGFRSFGYIRDTYWKAARNVAYLIAILAIIVFAFMIMFRVKISPQVVISVQSALPKLIGAVILATFSYAIAGFVIDLMYVVAGLMASILQQVGITSDFDKAYNVIIGNPWGWLTTALGGPIMILVVMLVYAILFLISVLWNFFTSFLLSLSLFTGGILTIAGLLVFVWIVILTIWYTFKIPYILIKTAIAIYLSIMIAPIQIMFGVFAPQAGFSAWIKNLIANVMVFPVTGLLIFLAYDFLMASYYVGTLVGVGDVIRLICESFGNSCVYSHTLWNIPFIGQDASGFIFLFISFGLIVAIPKATDLMKALIMGEKFSFGSAIGEALSPVKTGVGIGSTAGATYYSELGESNLRSDDDVTRQQGQRQLRIGAIIKGAGQIFGR